MPSPAVYVDPDGQHLLHQPEDVLIRKLGIAAFQLQQYGQFDSSLLIKEDFLELGRQTLKKVFEWVRKVICPRWESIKLSGLDVDAQTVFLFVLAGLLGSEFHPRIAWVSAAIISRRGLNYICTHWTPEDTEV